MKETFYFSHDYNARSDVKIKKLLAKYGMAGYGIYWSIIEDLYQNANALPTDYEGIAYDLRVDCDTINSIINDFGLFTIEDGEFGSLSVQRRLDERAAKSNKAREIANKRWGNNANAMPTHSESNAIKESKGKERKENKTYSDFDLCLNNFIDFRKKKKAPMTDHAIELLKKKLQELAPDNEKAKIAIMEQSIINGWSGVFPLNESNKSVLKQQTLELWTDPSQVDKTDPDAIKKIPPPENKDPQSADFYYWRKKWNIDKVWEYQVNSKGYYDKP
jgi:hypothetical protein